MNEIANFKTDQTYNIVYRKYNLKIFREGIGKYTDKLKKYRSPQNKKIEEKININEHIAAWLDNHIQNEERDWGLVMVNVDGGTLQIIKSTLPLLLASKNSDRQKLIDDGAFKDATEGVDDEISKIKAIMSTGIMADIPVVDLLEAPNTELQNPQDTIKKEISDSKYEVALSYASENIEYVNQVAAKLKKLGVNIFFDKHQVVETWGKDLAIKFKDVFGKKSRFVVIFHSQYYKNKAYPRLELQNALAKSIKQSSEYILPIKFDDTEIPGLPETVAYLKANEHDPEEIAQYIFEKIKPSI